MLMEVLHAGAATSLAHVLLQGNGGPVQSATTEALTRTCTTTATLYHAAISLYLYRYKLRIRSRTLQVGSALHVTLSSK